MTAAGAAGAGAAGAGAAGAGGPRSAGAPHHLREGAGPPLVLLAGIGMDSTAWAPVLGRLTPSRDVWRVDLPGFGGSAAVEGEPPGIAALASATERFFAAAGLQRPHVAGSSLGGAVALELARRGSVASATALSPVGFWSRPEAAFARLSLVAIFAVASRLRPHAPALLARPRLRRLVYAQLYARADRLSPGAAYGAMCVMLDSSAFHATLAASGGHRVTGPLAAPATIAWGTRDALLLPTGALRARRVLPEARHLWLRGCGHLPMSDDPDQVARVLLEGSRG